MSQKVQTLLVSISGLKPDSNDGASRLVADLMTGLRARSIISQGLSKAGFSFAVLDAELLGVKTKEMADVVDTAELVEAMGTLQRYMETEHAMPPELELALRVLMPLLENMMIEVNSSLYHVIEKNVDGSGSDADIYVRFARKLSVEEEQHFAKILNTVKQEDEDTDTEGFVLDALERFSEEAGIKGETATAPSDGYFEF